MRIQVLKDCKTMKQIAFVNDGGLRSNLEIGDITGEDVFSVLPFNNTVDLIQLTGRDIIEVLEWNIAGLCDIMLYDSFGRL